MIISWATSQNRGNNSVHLTDSQNIFRHRWRKWCEVAEVANY